MVAIKPATVTDIPIIHSLAHNIWPLAYKDILSKDQLAYMLEMMYSREALYYQMEKQEHLFFVIFQKSVPIGFASVHPKYKTSPSIFRLNKLYLLPSFQGKGLGTKFLNFLERTIKRKGALSIELNVNRANKAQKFYEKMGFTIVNEVDVPIGNGYFMNDFILQKTL